MTKLNANAEKLVLLKKELRRKIAAILAQVSEEEINRQTKPVIEKVVSSNLFEESKRISVYVNTSGEIKTDSLISVCFQLGKEVFIPQFKKGHKNMRMLRVTEDGFQNLSTVLWNIRQPADDCDWAEYYESGPLDLVLLPGVAFSKEGLRLGHGMGFYDKFLREHKERFGVMPKTIGLSLNEQLVDVVPVGETDVTLDTVFAPHNS